MLLLYKILAFTCSRTVSIDPTTMESEHLHYSQMSKRKLRQDMRTKSVEIVEALRMQPLHDEYLATQ